jgi:cellulose synthase/poly-beta-1,6-N-acetylglucosamine synthase-like glycosyltransferase
MQALDWFVLFSAAAATTRLGYPTTAVGTNLSVRRQAYDSTGGYRKIPFSVTEDYALFHAVATGGRYKARFPLDRRTLVESEPCTSWKVLHRQKKRWFAGGRGMDMKSIAVFAVPYLVNLALLAALVFSSAPFAWWCLAAKVLIDLLMCLPALFTYNRTNLVRVYPLYWFYYFGYVLLYPPLVILSSKVMWKERSFT